MKKDSNGKKNNFLVGTIVMTILIIFIAIIQLICMTSCDVHPPMPEDDGWQIKNYNSTFEKYLTSGDDTVSGSHINSLLQELRALSQNEEMVKKYGSITFDGSGAGIESMEGEVSSNKRYKVFAEYYSGDSQYAGSIKSITVIKAR